MTVATVGTYTRTWQCSNLTGQALSTLHRTIDRRNAADRTSRTSHLALDADECARQACRTCRLTIVRLNVSNWTLRTCDGTSDIRVVAGVTWRATQQVRLTTKEAEVAWGTQLLTGLILILTHRTAGAHRLIVERRHRTSRTVGTRLRLRRIRIATRRTHDTRLSARLILVATRRTRSLFRVTVAFIESAGIDDQA